MTTEKKRDEAEQKKQIRKSIQNIVHTLQVGLWLEQDLDAVCAQVEPELVKIYKLANDGKDNRHVRVFKRIFFRQSKGGTVDHGQQ
jgi:hypothetical protein